MKISKYLALLAAVSCAAVPFVRAEDAPAAPTEKPDRPARPERPNLTDAQKASLKAALETAKKDPAVVKAEEAVKTAREAKDRKASMEARKTLHEALTAAVIKADPTLADLLKKYPHLVDFAGGRGERGGRGGRGEGRGRRGGDQGPGKDAPPPPKPADA